MFIVVQSKNKYGEEIILKDSEGNPIIYETIEEAKKAIENEIDQFVDELCDDLGRSLQNEDEV